MCPASNFSYVNRVDGALYWRLKQYVGECQGVLHPYTARAQSPLYLVEQMAIRCVMEVNGKGVVEPEGHMPQGIPGTGVLSQQNASRARPINDFRIQFPSFEVEHPHPVFGEIGDVLAN